MSTSVMAGAMQALFPAGETVAAWLRRMAGPQPYDWDPDSLANCWLAPGVPLAERVADSPAGAFGAVILGEAGLADPARGLLAGVALAAACGALITDEVLSGRTAYPDGHQPVWVAIKPDGASLLWVFFAESAGCLIRRSEQLFTGPQRFALYQALLSESVRAHAGAAAWLSWQRKGQLASLSPAAYQQNLSDRWAGLTYRLPVRLALTGHRWDAAGGAALVSFAEQLGVFSHLAADWRGRETARPFLDRLAAEIAERLGQVDLSLPARQELARLVAAVREKP